MAKAFFQQTNADGVSLHSHLSEVIHKLLISKDPAALDNLENISLEIKKQHFTAKEPGSKNPPAPLPTGSDWAKRSNKLFSVDTSEEDEDMQPLLDDMTLFEWQGVGLGQEELYRVFLAMASLKAEHGLKKVRFFGKMLGTEADYYVVQGFKAAPTPPADAPAAEGVPVEPSGTGLNTLAYFVSTDVSMPFVPLPDVTPEQVVAAGQIKKYLTGSLDAPVRCFPPFPGNETNFLRAQIARISAATVLVPAGKYKLDEESESTPQPIIEDPEYEAKDPKEMAEGGDSWVKLGMGILKIGRCTNPPKPEPKEDEEEAAEEEELEEEVAALLPASEDKPLGELALLEPVVLDAWSFKLHNAKGAAVAIAKSARWPGAYSAVTKSTFANVYIGYGVEASATPFTPQPPPEILAEAAELEEQAEVTLEAENELLLAIEDAKRALREGPALRLGRGGLFGTAPAGAASKQAFSAAWPLPWLKLP